MSHVQLRCPAPVSRVFTFTRWRNLPSAREIFVWRPVMFHEIGPCPPRLALPVHAKPPWRDRLDTCGPISVDTIMSRASAESDLHPRSCKRSPTPRPNRLGRSAVRLAHNSSALVFPPSGRRRPAPGHRGRIIRSRAALPKSANSSMRTNHHFFFFFCTGSRELSWASLPADSNVFPSLSSVGP